MKPFNLKKARRGEPIYETTMGELVHFVGIARDGDYVIESDHFMHKRTGNELRMAPVKRTVWVNLYHNGSRCFHYETEAQADHSSFSDRMGGRAYPVEIEE